MSGENNDSSMNRRALLKGLGAGTASVVGMSGMAASSMGSDVQTKGVQSQKIQRAAEAFATNRAVEQALLDTGAPVRETLEAEGISLSLGHEEFDEVRTFGEERDGVPTAHIVAERNDGAREIEFHVFPQADDAFAVEKTDSGLRRFEADDVKPAEFCETSTYCDGYCQCSATQPCGTDCEAGYEVEERCCQYSDGSYECERISEQCTYDCPGNDDCD